MKMSSSGLCSLRARVKERLTAAAEDIFELFERSISQYEEEVRRLKRRNSTQLWRLEQAGLREEAMRRRPEEERREEEQCFGIKQEGVQIVSKLPFTPVCVKTEDEDKLCVLHQRPAASNREETNVEDCGSESKEEQLKGLGHISEAKQYVWSNSAVMCSDTSLSHIGANNKPFKCSECSKEFQRKEYLKNHMIVHTGERPFSCPFCSKCFNQQGNLSAHIRIHTGEKPYSCSVCQRCFRDRGTLSKHMTTHGEQRPFGCTVCGKSFKQKGNLKGHMRTHTGDKPYSCQVCGKEFANKNCRNTHMRIHTGEKPFSCTVCKKRFSDLSNLSHHEKTHRR